MYAVRYRERGVWAWYRRRGDDDNPILFSSEGEARAYVGNFGDCEVVEYREETSPCGRDYEDVEE